MTTTNLVKRKMSSIEFDVWQVVLESWEWKQQPCTSLENPCILGVCWIPREYQNHVEFYFSNFWGNFPNAVLINLVVLLCTCSIVLFFLYFNIPLLFLYFYTLLSMQNWERPKSGYFMVINTFTKPIRKKLNPGYDNLALLVKDQER